MRPARRGVRRQSTRPTASSACCLAEPSVPSEIRVTLERIQHELFDVGAELSLPAYVKISAEHVAQLETELDALNAELPPLKEFVSTRRQPGGGDLSSCAYDLPARGTARVGCRERACRQSAPHADT